MSISMAQGLVNIAILLPLYAYSIFAQMIKGEFTGNKSKTRNDLLEYCKLDTLAMVEILKKLYTLTCQ